MLFQTSKHIFTIFKLNIIHRYVSVIIVSTFDDKTKISKEKKISTVIFHSSYFAKL